MYIIYDTKNDKPYSKELDRFEAEKLKKLLDSTKGNKGRFIIKLVEK